MRAECLRASWNMSSSMLPKSSLVWMFMRSYTRTTGEPPSEAQCCSCVPIEIFFYWLICENDSGGLKTGGVVFCNICITQLCVYMFWLGRVSQADFVSFIRNRDFQEVTLERDGETLLQFAAVYGFRNIQTLVHRMRKGRVPYQLVEVLSCPGGNTTWF